MKILTKAILWQREAKRNDAHEIGVGGLCPPLSANLKCISFLDNR